MEKDLRALREERKERFQTDSGTEVKPPYTPLDLEEIGFDYTYHKEER